MITARLRNISIMILNPKTISIMKTVHYPDAAHDQGLIWYYKILNERTLFGHSGSDKGSLTEMFISPSDNFGVVLLSNSRSHEGMALIENAVFNYAAETDFIASGDLNSDDEINNQDINALVNLIMAGEYTFLSDLNLDNKMDILDYLELVELITS